MTDSLVESKTAEAAHAAAVSNEASQSALVEALHQKITSAVRDAVRDEMSPDRGRFIDVSRLPLICQSIVGIDVTLQELKQQMVTQNEFWPVKTLVYGFVGIMLLSVVGALLSLVILNHS